MRCPVDVTMSGAVSLGLDTVCDGFLHTSKTRVQTHVHADHMGGFESSKGCQEILVSEPTRQFLIFDYDADIPYRANIRALIESRIIYRQSKQREDCFQKAVIKRGLRRMRRSA